VCFLTIQQIRRGVIRCHIFEFLLITIFLCFSKWQMIVNGRMTFSERGRIHICYLPAGRSVWWITVTEGSIFKPKVTVFHYTDRPYPANNMFFFSCSKLALQITNGFVYAALVIQSDSMGLRAVYQRFVKNLGNERVTQIVGKRKM